MDQQVLFEDRFLESFVGSIVTDPAIAIVELVANCWDAYATEVKIGWSNRDLDKMFFIWSIRQGAICQLLLCPQLPWCSGNSSRENALQLETAMNRAHVLEQHLGAWHRRRPRRWPRGSAQHVAGHPVRALASWVARRVASQRER